MNAYFVVQGCLKLVFRLREAVCCLHLLTRSIERVNLTWDIYTCRLSLTQVSIQTFPANQDIHISISVLFLQCSFYCFPCSFKFISCSIHQSLFLQCSLTLAFILLKHFIKCKYFHVKSFLIYCHHDLLIFVSSMGSLLPTHSSSHDNHAIPWRQCCPSVCRYLHKTGKVPACRGDIGGGARGRVDKEDDVNTVELL